jgi:hypothetical protein
LPTIHKELEATTIETSWHLSETVKLYPILSQCSSNLTYIKSCISRASYFLHFIKRFSTYFSSAEACASGSEGYATAAIKLIKIRKENSR